MLPLAADRGFSFADPYAIALAFAGVAVFAAVGALSHERERAFSASLIYLALGVGAATIIDCSACAGSIRSTTPWRSSTSRSSRSSSPSSEPG